MPEFTEDLENVSVVDGALYFRDVTAAEIDLPTPEEGTIFVYAQENDDGNIALFAKNSDDEELEFPSTDSLGTLLSPAATNLTYAGTVTPNANDGLYRKTTLTGNMTLNPPTNPVDGMKWKYRVTASGADRTLTVNAAILAPSDGTFAGTKVLTSGLSYLIQLEYWGSAWHLETLIGGYA